MLTNCDTFEHFPPFPFSLMPPIARLPGGTTALQAPFRFGAVRRIDLRAARQDADRRRQLVDSWLEPAAADPEIKRDLTKILRGIRKQELIEADEKLRSFERPVRFAWAHRRPLLQALARGAAGGDPARRADRRRGRTRRRSCRSTSPPASRS